jgi:phosphoribosylanthranilate isomerase
MWVKICANTNLEDTKLAAELGADAVGFVFAPSKRQVTPEQVAAIIPRLPAGIEKIGVFMTRDAYEIAETVRSAGLTGVQLHGGLNLSLARRLRKDLGREITIVQTLHWIVEGGACNKEPIATQLRAIEQEPTVDRVLVDSKTGSSSGGGGVSFDWARAQETLTVDGMRVIVAGGLHPGNVAAAIATLRPWGVDVAGGVESVPGRKDPEKLRRFIENARSESADSPIRSTYQPGPAVS